MIPDFPLFFPVVSYWQSHDPAKVFTICLPFGVAAFVLFHMFLKIPLVSLCPRFLQERIAPYATAQLEISFRYWLFVFVAVVIGAYTHILWDSFTHGGRWGTRVVPAVNQIVTVGGHEIAIFKLLQHGSSVGGLLILAVLSIRLLSQNNPVEIPRQLSADRVTKFLAALLMIVLPMISYDYLKQFDYSILDMIGLTIRLSGALLVLALVSYAFAFHVVTKGRFVAR